MTTPIQMDDHSPSTLASKPRGILKRPSVGAEAAGPRPTGLAWDEENLTINELGKVRDKSGGITGNWFDLTCSLRFV